MKTQHIGLAIALLVSTSFVSIAQTTGQKIGENPTTKHPGAILDLESTDKGVLFPRVALSNTTTWGLAGTATKGMLIYNTKTTTDGFTGTTAYPVATGDGTGVYFWDGTGWAAAAKTSGSDPTIDAWIDDPTNTQVKLGTLSNGAARTDDKAFVAKDDGKVGIGLINPVGILDINGKMYVNNKQTIYNADALDTKFTGSLFIGNGGTKLTTPDPQKGKYNSSLGIDALFENTSGFENTAIGALALKLNTAGFDNTAIGVASMRDNTSGDQNTALGQSALRAITTGDHNTALGANAMRGLTTAITGNLNTVVGYQAMSKLTSGSQNTVLGSAPVADVVDRITTGSDNTFVGYNTGGGITTGGKNSIFGANVATLPAALSNNIILADGDGNQRIRVLDNGNTGIGVLTPKSRLDINGYAKLGSVDAPADALTTVSDRAGMIRYNSTSKALQYHDDTQWVTAASTATADLTSDAWVDDPTNTQVKLGTLSNGTTRSANAAFVAKDDGKVGIGTATPVSKLSLEDNASGTYVQLATFLAPSNNVVNHNTLLKLGTSTTTKNSTELRFNYQDDGSDNNRLDVAFHGVTAPALSVLTGGNVGIGTTAPSAKLEVNGNVEISTVDNVPNNTLYKPLVWNPATKRVETTADNSAEKRVVASVGSGATATVGSPLTTISGGAGYEIKILVTNSCGVSAYSKFIASGSTVHWRIGFMSGISENGPASGVSSGNGSTVTVSNPLSGGCADGGNGTALNYTVSISNSGQLSITNNGNITRTYAVIMEKVIE